MSINYESKFIIYSNSENGIVKFTKNNIKEIKKEKNKKSSGSGLYLQIGILTAPHGIKIYGTEIDLEKSEDKYSMEFLTSTGSNKINWNKKETLIEGLKQFNCYANIVQKEKNLKHKTSNIIGEYDLNKENILSKTKEETTEIKISDNLS